MKKSFMLVLVTAALCGSNVGGASANRSARLPKWNPGGPGGFAFGFGSAWIAGGNKLLRVDPKTNRVVAKISANGCSWPLAAADSLWVSRAGQVMGIDPSTNSITKRIDVDTAQGDPLAYGFGSLWLVSRSGQLFRIDPTSGKVLAAVKVQGAADWSPMVAAGAGSVWIGSGDRHAIIRVNPATNTVAGTVSGISHAYSLLTVGVGYGAVWAHANAAAGGRGILYRIDPAQGKTVGKVVTSHTAGGQYGGTDIAFGGGSVWTSNGNDRVSRIRVKTLRLIHAKMPPVASANFIGFGYRSVWVQDYNSGEAVRIPAARFRR